MSPISNIKSKRKKAFKKKRQFYERNQSTPPALAQVSKSFIITKRYLEKPLGVGGDFSKMMNLSTNL